jgi:membrane-associated phospholipid phosphatase
MMNDGTIRLMAAETLPFLLEIYRRGLDLIKIIQGPENPGLTLCMRIITSLGTEYFYIPLILLIYWCIDEKRGFRLGCLIILSGCLNLTFKGIFKQPRPYELDPSVGKAFEPSYGIPSGHAQNSLVFWFPVSRWARRRRVTVMAAALILLIGLSRLYLGVHFPTDLLAGWVLGALWLVLFFLLEDRLGRFLAGAGTRARLISAAGAAFAMNALLPGEPSLGGMFFGFSAGYTVMLRYFPFSAASPRRGEKPALRVLILRIILGLAGAALIYLGLKKLLPGEGSLLAELPGWGGDSPYYGLGRFIRYGLLGFWASAGAPRLFLKLRLTAPAEEGSCRG